MVVTGHHVFGAEIEVGEYVNPFGIGDEIGIFAGNPMGSHVRSDGAKCSEERKQR